MHLPVAPKDDDRSDDDALPEGGGGPYATEAEREAMLRDAALKGALRGVIARKVPERDVEDVLQMTLLAAHKAPGLPAGGGAERDRYAMGIAHNHVIGYHRAKNRGTQLQLGATDDFGATFDETVPAAPGEEVVRRDFLEKLTVDLPEKQLQTFRCMVRNILGENLTDIAEELGLPYDTLRKRVDALRERLVTKATRWGGGGLAVLLAILLGPSVLRPRPHLGADEVAMRTLDPGVSTRVGRPDPADWAAVLRSQALRACVNGDWGECIGGLDAARELDPDGERSAIVAAARADAAEGLVANAKPGSHWVPRRVRLYAPFAAR